MNWRDRLSSGKSLLVIELLPPKGNDVTSLERKVAPLKGIADALYVPSLQGGVMTVSSWAACKSLQERGYETIFEVSCANANRVALQAELLGASALGLQNLMVLLGDDPSQGDHHEARRVYDVGLLELLSGIQRLQDGHDMAGGDLEGTPRFCVGTRVNASVRDQVLDLEMRQMEHKISLGVNYFMTTPIYDLKQFEVFVGRAHTFGIPIIAGVTILKSAGMARYINKHLEGALIPEEMVLKLMKAPDKVKASLQIAADAIRELRGLCQGVNIIALGWEDKIPSLLDAVRP